MQSFVSFLTQSRITTSLEASLKTSLPYSHRRTVTEHESVAPTPHLRFKICYSESFGSLCCLHVHGLPCDSHPRWRVSDDMDDRGNDIRVSHFYGPVKILVLALHENKEALSFLQQQVFAPFTVYSHPSALLPCSAAYKITFRFNST
jgi:hypothetical protein